MVCFELPNTDRGNKYVVQIVDIDLQLRHGLTSTRAVQAYGNTAFPFREREPNQIALYIVEMAFIRNRHYDILELDISPLTLV